MKKNDRYVTDNSQAQRDYHGRLLPGFKIDPFKRFIEKVEITAGTGCHEWSGFRNSKGYGIFWNGERTLGAHRWAWEYEHGPIENGLFILHRCDNPPCVNTEHLFVGTHDDNMADMIAKGRQSFLKGTRNPRAKLTDAQIREIRKRYIPSKVSQQTLANEYGVNQTMIGFIVRGASWSHLKDYC